MRINEKPWYDCECAMAKRLFNNTLRKFRHDMTNVDKKSEYVNSRRMYNHVLTLKKNNYERNLKDRCHDLKNPKMFWQAIKSFGKRKYISNPIPLVSWENFYAEIHPLKIDIDYTFFGIYDDQLDREISIN